MMIKMTFKPLKKYLPVAPLALLVLAATVAGSLVVAQRAQAGADDREVKNVVLTAFNTSSTFGAIEHISGSTKTPPSEDLSVPLKKNDVEAARERARVTLSGIFAPNCTVCALTAKGADEGITAEGDGVYRIVASGMRDVDWRQVTINGDNASVTVAATTWIKTISRNEFGKVEVQTPTEGRVKIFTLAKQNGHWVITNIVQDQVATGELPVNKRPDNAAKPGEGTPAKPSITPQGGVKDTSVQ
jgi:hypothetical protein